MGALYDKVKGTSAGTGAGSSTGGSLYNKIKSGQGNKPTAAKKAVSPAETPTPFDATNKGIALNTIEGLPDAAVQVGKSIAKFGKEVLQGTARGLSTIGRGSAEKVDPTQTPAGKLFGAETFFGTNEPFSLESETAPISKIVSEKLGVSEKGTQKVLVPVMGALNALDILTGGGKKEAIIQAIKTVDSTSGARRLLQDAGIADKTIDTLKLDSKAVAAKTDAEAESVITSALEQEKKVAEINRPLNEANTADFVEQVKQGKLESSRLLDEAQRQRAKDASVIPKDATPSTPVKVYRAGTEDIGPDSFVTTSKDAALKYAKQREGAKVYSKEVTVQDLVKTKGLAHEFVYAPKQADSVISYIDKNNQKVFTRVSPEELNVLRDEINVIPESIKGESQIHLDAFTPRVADVAKEIPRSEFIAGHSQAQQVFEKAGRGAPLPQLPKFVKPENPDTVINSARQRYEEAAAATGRPDREKQNITWEDKVSESSGEAVVDVNKIANKLLVPISSRLGRINPKLKEVLRKFEFSSAQNTAKDSNRILPLLQATKKLSPDDAIIFDLARKNGDATVIDAIGRKYGISKEIQAAQDTLDEIYDRAVSVGIEVPYRENYFPRVVKNPRQFLSYLRGRDDWSNIQDIVEKHAAERGKKYTDLTPEEISGIVNNFIRGYGDKVQLASPNFAKQRTIEVIDDTLNEFYASADEALSTYVIRMNDEIEGRKFFGKALNVDEKVLNTEDSIGSYVMDLIQKGELKPEFEEEVADILRSRFARGKMNGALDAYRNLEYISTMGSPISAITQIGDLAFSLYDNGFYNTAKGLAKSITKNADRVTKEDLGIEQITQEFTTQSGTGKVLDKVFKLVGLERLDRLGKETLVNAEMSKFQSMALRDDEKLRKTLAQTFDKEEIDTVVQEFADGKLTENTKLVLFNKLLDFQPVAKSEMPQAYLENPNGRIFYMLKSFTLKQYDIFRREAIDKIASGEKYKVIEGTKNLMYLAGAFTLANAGADEIKDLILDRDTPPSDRVVDNLWRLVGASKYDVYKARTDGVGQTVLKKILFPTSFGDRLYKDVTNMLEGKEYEKGPMKGEDYKLESTQSIPVGGKLYYWWLGRGEQKERYKESQNSSGLPELPELPKLPKIEI